MNKTIRNVFASAALAFIAAGSASAGVLSTGMGVTYTATVSGNILDLTIDATKNNFKATELDILVFNMVGLNGAEMISSPTAGWTGAFENNASGKDYATFSAASTNHTALAAPLQFSFEFAGDKLDFNKLGLKARFDANGLQSDSITALNVTAAEVGTDPSAVPEPASVALLLGGLGLLGAVRRKASRV